VAALFEARTVVNIVTPCVVVLGRFNKGVNIQQSSASTKKSVDDIRRDVGKVPVEVGCKFEI
jgi:hypothetical protein